MIRMMMNNYIILLNKILRHSCLIVFTLLIKSGYCGLYNPQSFTLKNGLNVVVLENNRADIVSLSVWYKAGAIDDPSGQSGLAHFLEHMMFKGPEGSASARYSTEIKRIGGEFNASTDHDYTNYYATVAKEHLEKLVILEAGRMRDLTIVPEQAQNELQVILQERNMRLENNPLGRFYEIIYARFFYNHPYRLPGIGWEHDIRLLTAQNAKDFYDKWYAPNNATLIFAGNITIETARQWAEKYFADIPAKDIPAHNYVQEPPHRDLIEHLYFNADEIQNPYFIRAYPGPNFKFQDGKLSAAFKVLEYILTVNPWGLWYDDLVTKRRIASFVQIEHSIYARDPNIFTVIMQPVEPITLKELETAFDRLLDNIITKGISAEMVERAKRQIIKQTQFTLDNVLGGADNFGQLMTLGIPLTEIDNWLEQIKAVTANDVNTALGIIFNKKQYMNAYLLPNTSTITNSHQAASMDTRAASIAKDTLR